METDVLSDILRVVRLVGSVFFTAELSAPWSIQSPPSSHLAQFLQLQSDCVTLFHTVVEGRCQVLLENRQPIWLEAGDVIILPRGAEHVMGSTQWITPTPIGALLPTLTNERIPTMFTSGSGEMTRFICSYLYCDQQFNPLLGALPDALIVSNRSRREPSQPHGDQESRTALVPRVAFIQSGEWLDTTLRYAVEEASSVSPGNIVMLGRLVEILFVEALRRYMQELPQMQRGWLAGVKDPMVGKALQLMHAKPEYAWTVEELAQTLAVSRSTLADRFVELIGEPPMRYLTRWRMQLAQYLLRQTHLTIYSVAEHVGYASEEAFNRAFKRYVGRPPASWRLSES